MSVKKDVHVREEKCTGKREEEGKGVEKKGTGAEKDVQAPH